MWSIHDAWINISFSYNNMLCTSCNIYLTPLILFDIYRYGRVICCIGVNPNKQYDVTPQTRAQILREMFSGSDDRIRCKNVQVEGMKLY